MPRYRKCIDTSWTIRCARSVLRQGTLQQYAERLLRPRASKGDVRIIDIVDTGHAALLRMWQKRVRGYAAMGYRIIDSVTPESRLPDLWTASVTAAGSGADSTRT